MCMSTTRRQFLATAGSFALTAVSKDPADAAMGPNDKFDLVIKGGDVLDPSQSLRGKRDIGIRYGVSAAMAPFATQPPQEPALEQLGVEPVGFRSAMFPRYRDTRGMDHVSLYSTRRKPARQP